MNIIVTRPEEDGSLLKQKLEALGHHVVLAPLLRIQPRPHVIVPKLPYQALIVTSANAIRALTGHRELKSILMLTLGPQSLMAARNAGFENAEAHGGDLDGLAVYIRQALKPAEGPVLYLSGSATTGDLEGRLSGAGFECRRVIAYDALPSTDLGLAEEALRRHDVHAVLLYSPRSVRIWCELTRSSGLAAEAARVRYFCLSENVAAILPKAWARTVAESSDEDAMLSLLEPASGTR